MSLSDRVRVGIAGAGNILYAYTTGLARFPKRIEVARIADVDLARAEAGATTYGIPAWGPLDDLLADQSVDVVVNITFPAAHASVTTALAQSGKHVYTEKPLATGVLEAAPMLAAVRAAGRTLGSAPDTFLGVAGQTARAAIDRGDIGEIIGFTAFSTHSRVELWHPNPTFLFQPGGGPVFDLGPYYIAQLVNLLGPVSQVTSKTRIGAPVRRMIHAGRLVDTIDVTVATHANAVLTFASGAVGTLVMSSDIWDHRLPDIEIYGTEGTLAVPHPNWYYGDVRLKRHLDDDWSVVAPVIPALPSENVPMRMVRGVGVLDLIDSLDGAPQRTSADRAYHALDVMESIQVASDRGEVVTLKSTCERPAPVSAEDVARWNGYGAAS